MVKRQLNNSDESKTLFTFVALTYRPQISWSVAIGLPLNIYSHWKLYIYIYIIYAYILWHVDALLGNDFFKHIPAVANTQPTIG
jgi:hypothetical protein